MTIPPRRRGGQELPDSVQDRPEQNAGYDAVVHGDDLPGADPMLEPEAAGDLAETVPPAPAKARAQEIDEQAERDAAAEVRRRERRR